MTEKTKTKIRLDELIRGLDIPQSSQDKAIARYQSLGDWLSREGSTVRAYGPAIFPQGSFRLGTVVRPTSGEEEYDIDLICKLDNASKAGFTQRQLKELVGNEVKAYAKANGIKAPVTEGKRAWRLDYADEVSFHIDILACVPEDGGTVDDIVRAGVDRRNAQTAVALTCSTHRSYDRASNDWPTSNPEGYGGWFESRMEEYAEERRRRMVREGRYDAVEKVPTHALKSPLQRAIQILKRHRDTMFADNADLKPISMLLTTLAAASYEGETDVLVAIKNILRRMDSNVASAAPRVPNPVNPGEDFADKWAKSPPLERAFWEWLQQARIDFERLLTVERPEELVEHSDQRFRVRLSYDQADRMLGHVPRASKRPDPPEIIVRKPPKPWRSE